MDAPKEALTQRFRQPLAWGSGNTKNGIVLIADAPGMNEAETGKAFIGASGKFLDELLVSVNLGREDIYLTNVVKFRPSNRDPNKVEIAAFWPYLLSELQMLQPKVVVTLGRIGLNCFLPEFKISQVHGQPFKMTLEGINFMLLPLYHPAAALHNGHMRPILKEDFLVLGAIIETLFDDSFAFGMMV